MLVAVYVYFEITKFLYMGNLLACGQGHQFTQAEFVQADNMVGADHFDCINRHDIHGFL